MNVRERGFVLYLRISTWNQAAGDGIPRQFRTCVEHMGLIPGATFLAVFTEVASGDGPLPIRESAVRFAKAQGARVLVESTDRWTRNANDQVPDLVDFACPEERSLRERLRRVLGANAFVFEDCKTGGPDHVDSH